MEHIEKFNKTGFCLVKNAISNELKDFVTQYALFDEMQNFNPEDSHLQVPGAHRQYSDPAMETVLLLLQPIIEKYTGKKVFPTYSYYRVYRQGDDLKKHNDRESCEISATLCFNYSYDFNKYRWPLIIEDVPVNTEPGDMVIYKGCDLNHWRETFETPNVDDWQIQGFFHYVDAEGPYADFKYDKRKSIGERSNSMYKKQHPKKYIEYFDTKGNYE